MKNLLSNNRQIFCINSHFFWLLLPILFFAKNTFAEPLIINQKTSPNYDLQIPEAAQNNSLNPQKTTQNNSENDDEFLEFENAISTQIIHDPFEKYNRKIYKFNDVIDRYFFEHIARGYRYSVPKRARISIRNFLDNLSLPVSAFNSFTQGKTENGLATISTFIINSTIGVVGLVQIADKKGVFFEKEDFGQTLGHYKIGSENYLMLPFFGPSTMRDLGGFMFDRALDPTGFNSFKFGGESDFINSDLRVANTAIKVVDNREELLDILEDIRNDSFDPYATIRSAYMQRRIAQTKK